MAAAVLTHPVRIHPGTLLLAPRASFAAGAHLQVAQQGMIVSAGLFFFGSSDSAQRGAARTL